MAPRTVARARPAAGPGPGPRQWRVLPRSGGQQERGAYMGESGSASACRSQQSVSRNTAPAHRQWGQGGGRDEAATLTIIARFKTQMRGAGG